MTDAEFDAVAASFDAGVLLGEVIERDIIAVPVSAEQRQIVVAAPSYLAAAGTPLHPCEPMAHRCIGWRSATEAAPYRWKSTDGSRKLVISADAEMTTNDMVLMINMARSGAGMTIGMEETFPPWLERGELKMVLGRFCPPLQGFFLFHPSRRNLPLKFWALISHVQGWRRRGTSRDTRSRTELQQGPRQLPCCPGLQTSPVRPHPGQPCTGIPLVSPDRDWSPRLERS